jgi:hypothetical protein
MSNTPLLLVNPPADVPSAVSAGVLLSRDVVPLAASSARAVALDELASPSVVQTAVRAVRAGGRVLGPITLELPGGVTELVRDDRIWVGEKTAASDPAPAPRLISIRRAPP